MESIKSYLFLLSFVLVSFIPIFSGNSNGFAAVSSVEIQNSEDGAEDDMMTMESKNSTDGGSNFMMMESKNSTAAESYLLVDSKNTTAAAERRQLKGKRRLGPCIATNIIDKCWRCQQNWADNRQQLAKCALGFGQHATGGKGGKIYKVTDPSDDDIVNPKAGTLRHAVIQKEPLWIVFKTSMFIVLKQELIMTSNKTIDGRGTSVTIHKGAGITIQNVSNIIIHNIHIHDIIPTSGGMIRDSTFHSGLRTHDDGDGISIFAAKDIWLDHLSMSNCADGLIDAIEGSTGITISNCHFTDQDKAMLFGGRDDNPIDKKMQITLAYNHFGKRMMQRMPRCRTGFFHIVNNDYTHWNMYAIGGSSAPTIISQGNRFIAQTNLLIGQEYKKEITHRDTSIPVSVWSKWTWVSDGDIFQNGAHFTPSGDVNGAKTYAALELIKPQPAIKVGELTKDAGYLVCKRNIPC